MEYINHRVREKYKQNSHTYIYLYTIHCMFSYRRIDARLGWTRACSWRMGPTASSFWASDWFTAKMGSIWKTHWSELYEYCHTYIHTCMHIYIHTCMHVYKYFLRTQFFTVYFSLINITHTYRYIHSYIHTLMHICIYASAYQVSVNT